MTFGRWLTEFISIEAHLFWADAMLSIIHVIPLDSSRNNHQLDPPGGFIKEWSPDRSTWWIHQGIITRSIKRKFPIISFYILYSIFNILSAFTHKKKRIIYNIFSMLKRNIKQFPNMIILGNSFVEIIRNIFDGYFTLFWFL